MIAGPGFWDQEIEQAGWSRVLWPPGSAFPEIEGRVPVWGRNLYSRGSDRLIIEWSDPVTISAVLVNGRERRVDSADELAAIIAAPPQS